MRTITTWLAFWEFRVMYPTHPQWTSKAIQNWGNFANSLAESTPNISPILVALWSAFDEYSKCNCLSVIQVGSFDPCSILGLNAIIHGWITIVSHYKGWSVTAHLVVYGHEFSCRNNRCRHHVYILICLGWLLDSIKWAMVLEIAEKVFHSAAK